MILAKDTAILLFGVEFVRVAFFVSHFLSSGRPARQNVSRTKDCTFTRLSKIKHRVALLCRSPEIRRVALR